MNIIRKWIDYKKKELIDRTAKNWFLTPYLTQDQRKEIELSDPVRYGTIYLSLEQILKTNIPGALAECGVYKGSLSKFIAKLLPERRFYLFDTFEGFDFRDSDTVNDERFRDTSFLEVKAFLKNYKNIIFKKGFFPETTHGIEESFAFVMIDFDKYEPTLAALEFFYPLLNVGGFVFVHDYTSPESNWACSKALNEFLLNKPEKPILLPDAWGTAVFRKF